MHELDFFNQWFSFVGEGAYREVFLTKQTYLNITEDVIINGAGAAFTSIDGDGKSRVFDIDNNAAVTINDVTVQNGDAANGGGIYVRSGTTSINYSIIRDNQANNGGGIRNAVGATLNLFNVEFIDNEADFGGALH